MYRREPVISSSAESLLSEKGWRIGRTHGGSAVRLIPDLLSTHAAIMGKTGSGKSNILRLIISSIIQSSDGSIILLDPHGDLATDVAKSFPESAIMIPAKSIFIEEDERSITMNPLQGASENPEFYTGWIRDTFASNGVFSQGTWGPRLEVVFSAILGELIRTSKDVTLLDLLDLLLDQNRIRRFMAQAGSRELSAFLRMLSSDWRGWNQYITSSINKMIPLITYGGIRNLVAGKRDSTDFSAMFGMPGSLIIPEIWKGKVSEESYKITSMLLLLKLWSIRILQGQHSRPVYVVADESQLLPGNAIDHILREGRKFGIRIIMATQFLGRENPQLESILSNVGCVISFSLGFTEARTIASNFFSGPLETRLQNTLMSQGPRRAVIWARNSNGNHGPLSFIPDLFIPRDDGVNLDQLRERSVMKYGTNITSIPEKTSVDLHQHLIGQAAAFFGNHGLFMDTGMKMGVKIPDGVVDMGAFRIIVEAEVSDLVNHSRIEEKIRNYSGYNILFILPPGNAQALLMKILEKASREVETENADLLKSLIHISIAEYSGGFKFLAAGRLRQMRLSHLEDGTFRTTMRELGMQEIREFLFSRILSAGDGHVVSDLASRFGIENARRATHLLHRDGKPDLMKIMGVEA